MGEDGRVPLGSARTVRVVGLALGLALTAGLLVAILYDRSARLDAARRQSTTLATGTDRLLGYELRNLERALTGIAADGETYFRTTPGQAAALLSDTVAGVVFRHPELESVVLFDPAGKALSVGDSDPELPLWIAGAPRTRQPLIFGPLRRGLHEGWTVPIALRTDSGNWLVARLRTSEFQRMIDGLDIGREGSVVVLDRRGVVLARSSVARVYVGRRVPLPDVSGGTLTRHIVSELDGVQRLTSFSANSGYPVLVAVGIGMREALAPWIVYATTATALIALYWLGLWFLVRRMAGAEATREAMLEEIGAQADWLRQAQLAARSGVWRIEADEGHVRASEQAAALFGFAPGGGTIPIERFFERMHPEDRPRVEQEFAQARQLRQPFASEYRIVLPGDRIRWISARGALATDGRNQERMTGTIVDITERREALARIQRAETQFRELFERNPLPFWVFDVETLRFLAVNEAAVQTYGYTRAQFLTMSILDIRPDEDVESVRASMQDVKPYEHDGRVWIHLTRDGRRLFVRIHSSGIEFAGRSARLVLAEDVSERVAYERDLAWRATHDATTGLLNLQALVAQLDALPRPATGPAYAIAYVRLRDLELVAPTLGRSASEAILRAAAERFGDVGQEFGLAAYLPAETFVIAATDPGRRDALLARLAMETSTPVRGEGDLHPIEAWIGIAVGPREGDDAEQTIGNAALAALQARREGVPSVRFDAAMAARAAERLALAARLRLALERGEFELHFQPIRDIGDGRIVSLEALIRWSPDNAGYVPPSQFIPLCEESGLIVPLGEWALAEAARCHGLLAERGRGEVAIAVNVSAVQFLSETLPQSLRALRETHALPRGALQIELTESAVLRSPESARTTMNELREQGVCISIDDFGTGFSSMAYLKDLPLDFLKVDRTFVAGVDSEERNAAICRALIELGHGLGLKIIAEGVESAEQLDWLRKHGCDQAQGYYFGAPGPLADLLRAW
ncbi:EAL domain-containing protein [Luteimonas gilva]|uniref:EAL domain-containing protein n=1 Tax=Luteimonas gilva TaxID=2572684 RepID=A0A4U5JV53_9GAMM|nr:EAL domain-containing protein [Luteimonas gilva]TKR33774.1 EAL domain-containing protein [Luteimonas gilva]